MAKEIKSIRAFLQAALTLDDCGIRGLWGSGKLTEDELSDIIHMSATVSNCLGEMEEILKKFNLKRSGY